MRDHNQPHQPARFWILFTAAFLALIAAIFIAQPFLSARGESTVATYTNGVLHVSVPYHAERAGAGRLQIEVLNPEDGVVGRVEHPASVANGQGRWQADIKLGKPLALDDLVWHRVRYSFTYDDGGEAGPEGIESVSQIIRTPVVHILGQQSYLAGGTAAVRVIVTDSKNETISGLGTVRIQLLEEKQEPLLLFSGRLNRRGTTEAQFQFPAALVGNYQLRYLVDTAIGSTEFTQPVKLEDKVSVLLTTEKPIYQPGQVIHVRALALDRSNHEAAADRRLTFEIEDSRGNKVFKKITRTDKFGIASTEFGLADEVNLGTYHLRSLIGDADAPANTSEIALNVERYVLPKFKVAVELAGKNTKARRGYRPGDHVTGTVRANYFFGKPVEGEVTVKASAMDVAVFDAGLAQGKTDRDGAYHFDFTLPAYFAGRPLTQGVARVLIEATVKDSAGHAESRGEPITISESPLLITAVPEGGTLVPHLENEVFVLASYPDGTPAEAALRVHTANGSDQRLKTDASGVAIVRVNAGAGQEILEVDASDQEGNHALTKIPLQSRSGGEARILLRTERAVYRAGDRILLRVFSTQSRGTAYVDIVKEGQTVLTRDVDIVDGQAELATTAKPEMAGTVDVSAYVFGRDARPVADHRLVFVQPADELKVEATAENAVYKPGQDARVRFRVTNARGQGVQAALGLQVVDEAVFALAEKQPGFAKVFFYLEQEVLKPRYEIHSIGMSDIVEPAEKAQAEQRDRAARALFSATEMVNANKFETEFGRSVPQTKYAEYAARYTTHFTSQAQKLAEIMSREFAQAPEQKDGAKIFSRLADAGSPELRDSWSTPVRVTPVRYIANGQYLELRSAGPDKQFNTGDDLVAYLEVQRKKVVTGKKRGSSKIEANIEHDRGPMNGLAEMSGTAVDQEGRALDGASVRVTEAATRKVRTALVNADGQFSVNGLTPGDYQIDVVTQAETVSKKISLEARDRAVVSAFLGRQTEVTVVAVADEFRRQPWIRDGIGAGHGAGVGAGRGAPEAMDRMMLKAVPAPLATNQVVVTAQSETVEVVAAPSTTSTGPKSSATHVRSYFPEALYINPEIITDGDGRASVSIPLADSITTWRMAMLVSTRTGALGSATSSLKVFQDFFVDLDLPVTLTQGDRVSIPVAVYNYAGERGDVDLKLQPENWYSLVNDTAEKSVTVEPSRVGGSQFTLEARRIGKFKLTLSARMQGGAERADVVVREIEVVPNGREQSLVFNGRLEQTAQHELNFPASAVPDASKIFVRLYPGPLSQVIEGMDSLLRMPFGCFEQTSSSTYPNVLALDYMKRSKKLTPEVHAKAEGFIANGYQRLLTFEVAGGGFSWFGNAPANKILTAYGLLEFSDMSKVHDVDPKLIVRTQQWLAAQQQADGSWKPDTQFINEGATNRYNSDLLRITAYIAWALQNTGYQGPAVDRAKNFIEKHIGSGAKLDPYTLAVLANFAVDYGKDRAFTAQTMQMLIDAHQEKDDKVWWTSEETGVYSTGASASVETTALATQALLKWGQASGTARKALAYIAAKKDAQGAWGTTQATIMALRALLLATEKGSADVRGTLEVVVNGKPVQKLVLTEENNDLLHQFVFSADSKAPSNVELRFEGKGGLAYQVVGRYFIPWDEKPAGEPLNIDVAYDRTHLAQDDIATATATIRNNLPKPANMVMVDLGIPPGFDLLSEDLQSYIEKSAHQKSGRLEKFNLTATQAILYFDSFAAGDTVTLKFRLRAKYPIRAKTFESRVYEYYDPDVNSVARPVQLEVRGQ
jgi:A-macroglobulin TED domain/Alpha-2-macroglobulin family/A-macroglobulin receptor binding domain/MG2 domain/Alpha-2-macroglobulin bait region domain/Carboxypeptidase regulatory-like domain/Macroglobulin domain MG3